MESINIYFSPTIVLNAEGLHGARTMEQEQVSMNRYIVIGKKVKNHDSDWLFG